jgi:hypothetical protein
MQIAKAITYTAGNRDAGYSLRAGGGSDAGRGLAEGIVTQNRGARY